MAVDQLRILVKADGTEVLQEYAPYWTGEAWGRRWKDVPKEREPAKLDHTPTGEREET